MTAGERVEQRLSVTTKLRPHEPDVEQAQSLLEEHHLTDDSTMRGLVDLFRRGGRVTSQQVTLAVVFLPHQAWVSADAIVRTLWRLWVTRRHLLEWQTASHTERVVSGTVRDTWRTMWPALALTAGALLRSHLAWRRLVLRRSCRRTRRFSRAIIVSTRVVS